MNIQQAVKASIGKFPFVIISPADDNLTVEFDNTVTIKENAEFIINDLAIHCKLNSDRIVINGGAKQVAKFVTGPFSGIFARANSPEEFLEIWTFWSPKVTIGGSFIAAIDYSEPNPFVEHLVTTQNFIARKWSSLDFGDGYVSVKRSI